MLTSMLMARMGSSDVINLTAFPNVTVQFFDLVTLKLTLYFDDLYHDLTLIFKSTRKLTGKFPIIPLTSIVAGTFKTAKAS
jgi:hypothetical protein